jgi:hypothetical protein
MKIFRDILFVFLILHSFSAGAQAFIDTNKVWSVKNWNDTAYERRAVKLNGDTVIGTDHYTKFIAIQDSGYIGAWMPVGAREDGTAKKVYFYNNAAEYLAYDFSLNLNDTFRTDIGGCQVEMVVNSVDSFSIRTGEKRKRITFPADTWIEGIGSVYGPTYPALFSCPFDFIGDLICELENDTVMYHDTTDYENCFYSLIGIDEILGKPIFNIYPSPTRSQSIITVAYPANAKLIIYDMTGREVIQRNLTGNTDRYNLILPVMDNGIYIARLIGDGFAGNVKLVIE